MNKDQLKKLEADLWGAADKLRANSDLKSSEYATPVLGLIFLKFADNNYRRFESEILDEYTKLKGTRREKKISDIAIEKCGFYLPDHARYEHLLNLPEENAKTAKAVAEIKDVKELTTMGSKLAEKLVERATNYSREVYEVASEAQSQMSKLTEETLAGYKESITSNIETALKSAPAGADAAVKAFKTSMAVAADAVETITKAAQQVTSITEANLKAAADTAAQNVKAATKKAA